MDADIAVLQGNLCGYLKFDKVSEMSKYNINSIKSNKPKVKTYVFNNLTLEAHDEEVRRETMPDAIYVATAMYTAAFLSALRDTYGFGGKRLSRIFHRTMDKFTAIATGYVNYYDLAQTLKEECNVNIIMEKPDGCTVPAEDIYKAVSGMKPYKMRMR